MWGHNARVFKGVQLVARGNKQTAVRTETGDCLYNLRVTTSRMSVDAYPAFEIREQLLRRLTSKNQHSKAEVLDPGMVLIKEYMETHLH